MSRTFFRTQPYRASESGARRMHGYVEYASEESRGAQLTEERDTNLLTWKDERGEMADPHGWIEERQGEGYYHAFVLSPPPEANASEWTREEWDEWTRESLGNTYGTYVYTVHDDPEHPHVHGIGWSSDRYLAPQELQGVRERGDDVAESLHQRYEQTREESMTLSEQQEESP